MPPLILRHRYYADTAAHAAADALRSPPFFITFMLIIRYAAAAAIAARRYAMPYAMLMAMPALDTPC